MLGPQYRPLSCSYDDREAGCCGRHCRCCGWASSQAYASLRGINLDAHMVCLAKVPIPGSSIAGKQLTTRPL